MKWLYQNPIVLNLVVSLTAITITLGIPTVFIWILDAIFAINPPTKGFIGSVSAIIVGYAMVIWAIESWRDC